MSHLTDSERLPIEHELHQGISLQQVARRLGKNPSTISREVRKRRVDPDQAKGYAPLVQHEAAPAEKSGTQGGFEMPDQSNA